MKPLEEQLAIIKEHVVDLLPEEDVIKKLERSIKDKTPLRIKLGLDPSRPDIHIGHAVVLQKLRQFQELGHLVVLIIGDFTATIGDPTGKSKTRPALTIEETRHNGTTYVMQAAKVLDMDKTEVLYNSSWLDLLSFRDVIRLTSQYTVAQLLERDDFTKRYKGGEPISLHEFLYPLIQAYDSVAVKADIEIGGTDQKFNLLAGREIMRGAGAEPQCILTMPILEGTDGVEKMSKSLDNYIGLTDSAKDMFGKTMSIPDNLIPRYLKYACFAPQHEVESVEKGLADGTLHPRTAKIDVARRIVEVYHGSTAADESVAEFERIFVKKDLPDVIEEKVLPYLSIDVLTLLVDTQMASSKSEARRLVTQGGVSVDSLKVTDAYAVIDLNEQHILRVGKLRFLRIQGS